MKKVTPDRPPAGAPSFAFSASDLGRRLAAEQARGRGMNRTIAEYLLRNPVRGSAAGIEDLAAAIGTSPATLSRFARAVGFKGFAELRAGLAETLQSVLQPVEKLRDSFARSGPAAGFQQECLDAALANVRDAAAGLSGDLLEEVVRRIAAAETVYVMGFGLSAHVAGLLCLGLQPFRPAVVNVVDYGGTEVAAARLAALVPGRDVLVAISLPRYARDAVQLARFARDRGVTVIAITDSPASPLAPIADLLLAAPAAHPVLASATAAAVLVVEAIVSAVMASTPENVRRAEDLSEALSSWLHADEGGGRRGRP